MSGEETFLQAMRSRFACRKFDKEYRLSPLQRDYILECGRLSPSSFGLEPWRFMAVESRLTLASLGEACFGQEAVSSASLAACVLVKREEAFAPESAFVAQRAERFPGGKAAFIDDYRGYFEFLEREGRLLSWSRSQAYIACANMMTGAAAAGIASCAIEGFDETMVLSILGERESEWSVGLITVFGLPAEEPCAKIREPLDSVSRLM